MDYTTILCAHAELSRLQNSTTWIVIWRICKREKIKRMKTKIIGGITMSTQIKITHTFNAPRELVFKALTKSEHLMNWWGQKDGHSRFLNQISVRAVSFTTARDLLTAT